MGSKDIYNKVNNIKINNNHSFTYKKQQKRNEFDIVAFLCNFTPRNPLLQEEALRE